MGIYLNPPEGPSKLDFLTEHGQEVGSLDWSDLPANTLPVVWSDHVDFEVAGIGYTEAEFQALYDKADFMHTCIFLVPIAVLRGATDGWEWTVVVEPVLDGRRMA